SCRLDSLLPVNLGACPRIETPDNATIVHHIKILSIGHRRGHVWSIHGGPQEMRRGDITATAGFEREQRSDARRSVNDVVKNDRRRNDAIRRIVVGIETVRAPELFAV